jgi:glycosyltransferase involved in cell wall biosynthesis
MKLLQEDVVLIDLGDGPDRKRLESIVTDSGLSRRVQLISRVDHKEIIRFYSILDLFIVPRVDAKVCQLVTPLKPLEAMAMGKCVVASNVGGLSELLVDGQTGLLFQPGNIEDLAEKINLLLRDNETRSRIGREASAYVHEERSWRKVVSGYQKIYDHVSGKSSSFRV